MTSPREDAAELASCMDASEWCVAIAARRDRLVERQRARPKASPKRQAEIDMLGLLYRAVRAFDEARHTGGDLVELMARYQRAEQALAGARP